MNLFKNVVNEEKTLLKEQIRVLYKNEFIGAFIRSKNEILIVCKCPKLSSNP